MPDSVHIVYYNSYASEEVYNMISEVMPPGMQLLTLERDDEKHRLEKISSAHVAIVAATPLTRRIIDAAKRLELVHHQGVGYQDTVDTEALKQRGIPLALTPEGTTTPVAEMAILLMLAVYRRLPYADAELRRGRWHINALRPVSRNLNGRMIGYIAMGRIGQATAALARAFGATGIYYDTAPVLSPQEATALNLQAASFDEVIEQADIVTLHIPPSPEVRYMIGKDVLARMKPGAILINTARGMLVDEYALFEALRSGHLSGAGLDVFETEPPRPDNPLLTLPNVVLTPHISGGTRDAFQTKMKAIFENIHRFYSGQPLKNPVSM
ncbi:MAG: 2-hydroxyacid dehydrogenase [Deltaproteobacteria bacterium]|nr:2-hydroxyacid dehydrogenase [Deltaproteobacteria bacterium]